MCACVCVIMVISIGKRNQSENETRENFEGIFALQFDCLHEFP